MDIEEVAEHSPEKILRVDISPTAGLQGYQCRKIAFGLGFKGPQVGKFQAILTALYRIYLERDAALLEVNPLIVTKSGDLVALDAKINIDANAVFRQKKLAAMRDPSQEDPIERQAAEHDLNYVSLDGDIACMVNGAGLAMAHHGSHQAAWRQPGQLPRRGWRRDRRARHRGVQADPVEQEGEARSW